MYGCTGTRIPNVEDFAFSVHLAVVSAKFATHQIEGPASHKIEVQHAMLVRVAKPILVIADQVIARKTLVQNLKYYKYEVFEAEDASQGLMLLQEKSAEIGLVLIDLSKSEKIAEVVIAQLTKIAPTMKIIVCVEQSTEERKGQQAGVVGVLRKPVRVDRMLSELRKAFENT